MTPETNAALSALRTLSEKLRARLPQHGKQDMTNRDRDLVEYLEKDIPALIALLEASQREAPVAEGDGVSSWLANIIEDDSVPLDHAVIDGKLVCFANRPFVTNVSRGDVATLRASMDAMGDVLDGRDMVTDEEELATINAGFTVLERLESGQPAPAPGKAADQGAKLEELGRYLDDAIKWNNDGKPDDVFTALDAANMTLASLKGGR